MLVLIKLSSLEHLCGLSLSFLLVIVLPSFESLRVTRLVETTGRRALWAHMTNIPHMFDLKGTILAWKGSDCLSCLFQSIMGVFFYTNSVAFIEDVHLEETYNSEDELTNDIEAGFQQVLFRSAWTWSATSRLQLWAEMILMGHCWDEFEFRHCLVRQQL